MNRKQILCAAMVLASSAGRVWADLPINTLASFNGTNGANSYAGLTLSGDGNTLYGTTEYGGASGYGTVFSVPITGGAPMILASFNGTNGANPLAGLTLSGDGNTLYGTTYGGGTSNLGTVFSITLPEPASLVLFALGATGLLVRRKGTRVAAGQGVVCGMLLGGAVLAGAS